MTTIIRCDGICGRELGDRVGTGLPRVELSGSRAEFTTGAYGLPTGEFHLCGDCGRRAFNALRNPPPLGSLPDPSVILP